MATSHLRPRCARRARATSAVSSHATNTAAPAARRIDRAVRGALLEALEGRVLMSKTFTGALWTFNTSPLSPGYATDAADTISGEQKFKWDAKQQPPAYGSDGYLKTSNGGTFTLTFGGSNRGYVFPAGYYDVGAVGYALNMGYVTNSANAILWAGSSTVSAHVEGMESPPPVHESFVDRPIKSDEMLNIDEDQSFNYTCCGVPMTADTPDYSFGLHIHFFFPGGSNTVTVSFTAGMFPKDPQSTSCASFGIDNVGISLSPPCGCGGGDASQGTATNSGGGGGDAGPRGFDLTPDIAIGGTPDGAAGGDVGNGATLAGGGYLLDGGTNDHVIVAVGGGSSRWFDGDGTGDAFTERLNGLGHLFHDDAAGAYVLTDPDGVQTRFYDFSAGVPQALQGKMLSVTDPAANTTTEYHYDTTTHVLNEVVRTKTVGSVTTKDALTYAYVTAPDPNAGKVASVTAGQKTWDTSLGQTEPTAFQTLRTTSLTYYASGDANGNPGDLRTVTVADGAGGTIGEDYYRYYTSDTAPGHKGALKYVLHPASYARAAAGLTGGTTPLTATDAQLAPYADDYYEYDAAGRVTKHVTQGAGCSTCSGGLGAYEYTYDTGGQGGAPENTWGSRTVEARPDGNQHVTYYNGQGSPMLEVDQALAAPASVTGVSHSYTSGTDTTAVTLTLGSGHGYAVGDAIVVRGLSIGAYNGLFKVTSTTSTTVSYAFAAGDPGATEPSTTGATARHVVAQSGTFTHYDSDGRADWVAQPSALKPLPAYLYDLDGYGDLMHAVDGNYEYVEDAKGRVDVTVYGGSGTNAVSASTGQSTSGTPTGDAPGYVKAEQVRKGELGTAVTVEAWTYYGHTYQPGTNAAAADTAYLVATDTRYAGEGLSGGRTTTYGYTFLPDGNGYYTTQYASRTTTHPTVSVSHNGSGSADSTATEYYDRFGRVTWSKDEAGYLTYTAYDPATGAAVRQTTDADTRYATGVAGVLEDAPLGYWRLGEASGTAAADASGNGRTGTNAGTLTLGAAGALLGGDADTAVSFGGGHVTLPDGTLHDALAGGAASVEAWFKTTGSGVIFGYANDADPSAATQYVPALYVGTDGKLRGSFWSFGGSTNPVTSAAAVNDGAWHHAVVTASGSLLTLYLDGAPVGTQTGAIDPLSMTHNWVGTGTWANWPAVSGSTGAFGGTIDEVAVYGTALPGDRVAAHYSAGRGFVATTFGSRGGLDLTTRTAVDDQGRVTKATDPAGNVTYTLYDDAAHEVRTYPGWHSYASGTNTLYTTTGPVMVSRDDRAGNYNETLTFAYTPGTSATPLWSNGPGAANIQSLTRKLMNAAGQLVEVDRFLSLSGLTYATGAGSVHLGGTAGANYYATTYAYDARGRQDKVTNAVGTITRTVYDALGRAVSTWVGTDDAPTSGYWSPTNTAGTDLTKVSENLYDTYDPAVAVAGDSNLTRTTVYPSGTGGAEVTEYYYDWRDRQVASKSGVLLDGSGRSNAAGETNSGTVQRLATYTTYDNLDEATQTDTYDGDGVAFTTMSGTNVVLVDANADGVPDAPATSARRTSTTSDYDELGRAWQSKVFRVNQSTGAADNSLKTWNWYDQRGLLTKTLAPGGLATKYAYDGAGRVIRQYSTDAGGDYDPGTGTTWSDAQDVTGDAVLTQAETTYDADGNAILLTTRDRFHNAGTNVGDLAVGSNTSWARVSFKAFYYDPAGRLTDSVDVGTNGTNGAYVRPATVPTRSNNVRVTSYAYDDAGNPSQVTDPRGIPTVTQYDLLGRTTATIANYVYGPPSTTQNQTTDYTYDGADHVLTMKAVLPGSTFQTTQYVYGVTPTNGSSIASNDLLREVHYPDKSTGSASGASGYAEVFAYDAAGRRTSMTDRNGNVHAYAYDVLDRLTSDTVTTLGSGVDGRVLRLGYTYDTAGRPYESTSFSDTSGATEVNLVRRTYNGYGQLTGEYQEQSGHSMTVGYGYSEGGSGSGPSGNHSRKISVTYPNGRILRYEYGTAGQLDDKIGRLAFLADDSGGSVGTHIEEYEYLGLSTPVIRNRPQNGTQLTYVKDAADTVVGDAGDQYKGLDRFGRVIDQWWLKQSGTNTTTLDRFQYGYDADSNPLYMDNKLNSNFSELYHTNGSTGGYDGLNRLTDYRRGTLSDSNSDNVPDTVSSPYGLAGSVKGWSLDAVGNWTSSSVDGTSTSRTHDQQNELTAVGGASLAYDNNGNMTTDQAGKHLAYDAWNRLAEVYTETSGCCGVEHTTLESRYYDALGRAIEIDPQDSPAGPQADYLAYSDDWQVLEEDVHCAGGVVKSQYVWSPTYVDELIERDRNTDLDFAGTLDERLYAQTDANHDVTSLVNTSGAVAQRFDYDPYGTATVLSAGWFAGTSDAYQWNYLHQGGRYDPVSGLYSFRHREFSPALGRWVQQDPLGYVDGADRYAYLGSRPADRLDPQGTDWSDQPRDGLRIYPRGGSSFPGLVFVQLVVNVPAGLAKYNFDWHVTTRGGRDITEAPQPPGSPYPTVPGIGRGHEEQYFYFESDGPFWLLNVAVGGTGQQNPEGSGTLAVWRARNDGRSTIGSAKATLEVRCLLAGDEGYGTFGDRGFTQRNYNNLNRNFNLLDYQRAEPTYWEARRILYTARAQVTWNTGQYQVTWNDSRGQGGNQSNPI